MVCSFLQTNIYAVLYHLLLGNCVCGNKQTMWSYFEYSLLHTQFLKTSIIAYILVCRSQQTMSVITDHICLNELNVSQNICLAHKTTYLSICVFHPSFLLHNDVFAVWILKKKHTPVFCIFICVILCPSRSLVMLSDVL